MLSLRIRLFALILIPLLLVAALLGLWRYSAAQNTAETLFDRALLSAALAISRDVTVSGGDALLPSTRELIMHAAGGEVFYHATGPGGYYITGYGYPPLAGGHDRPDPYAPYYFEAIYRGEAVRVLKITEHISTDHISGDATISVWQRLAGRNAFTAQLARRAAILIGTMLACLTLVVWFGVRLGLRPLTDLQDAIARRSPDDLSVIKRPVPVEAHGIVKTLNRLLGQLENSINAHEAFISDASHQLRNRAAAVQSMAESIREAPDERIREQRIGELISAARRSSRTANQLLSLDRLQQQPTTDTHEPFDLGKLAEEVCTETGAAILSSGVNFEFAKAPYPLPVCADRVFVTEALKNLIDNAQMHGGSSLHNIQVSTGLDDNFATVSVYDDGHDLSPEDQDKAFGRFSQIGSGSGSGLGLAIAASVALRQGGSLRIDPVDKGASLTLSLPVNLQSAS